MRPSTAGCGPNSASRSRSSVKETAPGAAFSYSASAWIRETMRGTSAAMAARICNSALIDLGVTLDFALLEFRRFVLLRLIRDLALLRPGLDGRGQPACQGESQRDCANSHASFIVC